jgi:hypothetical protein
MKTAKDLAPNKKNPRKITDTKLQLLKKSLEEFGDLSGIVYNKKLNRLIGGHQRIKAIPEDAEIVIEKRYIDPTKTGTVAEGYIKLGTESMRYREVEWDNEKDFAANIAANKHGGDWDVPLLNEILLDLDAANYDMGLTGFTESELENLLAPISSQEDESDHSGSGDDKCPHCGK